MHDFGLAIRSFQGERVFTLLHHIERLFVVSKSTRYAKAVACNLAIIHRLRALDLPAWKHFRAQVSLFNEELGEISLGHLCNFMAIDTAKSHWEHAHKIYCLLPDLRATQKSFLEDYRLRFEFSEEKVDPASPTCVQVQAFLANFINLNTAKQYVLYPVDRKLWTNAARAKEQGSRVVEPPFWDYKTSTWPLVQKALTAYIKQLTTPQWSGKIFREAKQLMQQERKVPVVAEEKELPVVEAVELRQEQESSNDGTFLSLILTDLFL